MKRLSVMIVCVWFVAGSGSAHAQFLWNPFRKVPPPPPPAERVGQLVGIIKGDPDERKRAQAAKELSDFDTKAFPEIVPVLAEAAQNDLRAGVRAEAVSSLVRVRPVSPLAGQAIEHAAAKDENWRNKMSAQAALVRYRLAGYSPSAARNEVKPPTPPAVANQSQEPPLADRPPIIYHDQFGRVIPAPKNAPGTFVPGPNPVAGTPTSNPYSKMQTPFSPIAPVNSPPMVTPAVPNPLPQSKGPAPVSVEPVFRNANTLPTMPEPGPLVLTPPPISNVVPAAPTGNGPTLEQPRPINPAPMPASTPAPQGPTLDLPGASPASSPRLTPAP
jgi:hypothetical protein